MVTRKIFREDSPLTPPPSQNKIGDKCELKLLPVVSKPESISLSQGVYLLFIWLNQSDDEGNGSDPPRRRRKPAEPSAKHGEGELQNGLFLSILLTLTLNEYNL